MADTSNLGVLVADQASCWGSCQNSLPSQDICGDFQLNTVIFYRIGLSQACTFCSSCEISNHKRIK